jgi:replicative DNA helicase
MDNFQTIKELSFKCINNINNQKAMQGIKTGFICFDQQTNGLQLGTLTIIAARPSMGKTTFALNIAENIAIRQKLPLAYFSLEMRNEDCFQAILCSLTNIDRSKIRAGKCSPEERQLLEDSAQEISNSPFVFSTSCPISLTEVCENIEELNKDIGLKVVIIDYLQLLKSTCLTMNGSPMRMSEITRTLRLLALKLDIVIIALSQVNRTIEKRPNKRPMFFDLGQSGEIEQDASLVVFIYRDTVYNEDSPDENKAEIILAKNSFGPNGTIAMEFTGKYSKFEEFKYVYYDDYVDPKEESKND